MKKHLINMLWVAMTGLALNANALCVNSHYQPKADLQISFIT